MGSASLQVHLDPDFAPPTHLALGPAGQAGDDRQATPRGAFRADRAGMRYGTGTAGITNTQGESVLDEPKLHFDSVTLGTAMTDRVRNEFARYEQNVLHVVPVDPASAECSTDPPSRFADRIRVGRQGYRPLHRSTTFLDTRGTREPSAGVRRG